MKENELFLNEQLLTYIGNKRLLVKYIQTEVIRIQKELAKTKTVNADLFAGSGVVSRMLKQHSASLYVNDLEQYSYIINKCYLANKSEFKEKEYQLYFAKLKQKITDKNYFEGIITNNYAPKNDVIQKDDRVFYTKDNALIIDTIRNEITKIDENLQVYFLAPLLVMASVHVNTAGIFKGFYKDKTTKLGKFGGTNENALSRILKPIELVKPILSNFECEVKISCENANELAKELKDLDIVYLDPPYNQHPYGSNYFMLNVICENKIASQISKVSGIPTTWNRSNYNKKRAIYTELANLVETLDSKYIILSYNSDGFLTYEEIEEILNKYGEVSAKKIQYNTFKGSRNLENRQKYVHEYLFTLKKVKK